MFKDKSDDDENVDKSENTEETLEDEVNENDRNKLGLSCAKLRLKWLAC